MIDILGRSRVMVLAAMFVVVLLAGCTEEKAKALYAAARTFDAKAQTALDADVTLTRTIFAPTSASPTDPGEVVYRYVKGLDANQIPDATTLLERWSQVNQLSAQGSAGATADVRAVYEQFANSLRRLEQGNLLAGNAVACVTPIAAQLANGMLSRAENVQEGTAAFADLNRVMATLKAVSMEAGDNPTEAQKKTIATLSAQAGSLVKLRDSLIADAKAKSLDAAKAGAEVVRLAQDYGTLTLADILDVVDEFAGTLNLIKSFDLDDLEDDIAAARADMSGGAWDVLLAQEIEFTDGTCRVTAKTES
jgi:hypothetical protein